MQANEEFFDGLNQNHAYPGDPPQSFSHSCGTWYRDCVDNVRFLLNGPDHVA